MAGRQDNRASFWGDLFQRWARPNSPQSPTPSRRRRREPGRRVYAVGDIHGRLDLLVTLEGLIRRDLAGAPPAHSCLVFLGDYVDRGPASREVIDHLLERPPLCNEQVFLRGNHEQVLLDVLSSANRLEEWVSFGGMETLASYGIKPRLSLGAEAAADVQREFAARFPAPHLAFLNATRLTFETPNHFFVHAGIDPRRSLEQQRPSDLMWIREPFLASTKQYPKIIVHGHTPVRRAEIHPNRINIDTGAFVTGRLTCAVIDDTACRFLHTIG